MNSPSRFLGTIHGQRDETFHLRNSGCLAKEYRLEATITGIHLLKAFCIMRLVIEQPYGTDLVGIDLEPSHFHDDPYMKVMQAYNATNNESPIPPRALLLHQLFCLHLQCYHHHHYLIPEISFFPRRFCHLRNEPVSYNLLYDFSTHQHIEQWKIDRRSWDIWSSNHKVRLSTNLETELQEACTQISRFQREQIRHDDEIVLARAKISTLEMIIEDIQVTMALLPPGFLKPLYPSIMDMINAQDIKHIIPPTPPRDTKPPVESPIPLSPSSSVGSSSPVRSTTPPPTYPFDESIFAELDNSLWIILRPLKSKPVLEKPNKSDAC
ncbi:hypothetical protein Tco_1047589 [Tanacetum coccineum]